MSHNEKHISNEIQKLLSPSISIYKEVVQNQLTELSLDPKQFWIDNALITTYHYIRMFDRDVTTTKGVSPSTRQMSKL
jgi:hypothetical protein